MEQLGPISKRPKAYSEDGLKMYSGLRVRRLVWVEHVSWLVGYMGSDHVLLHHRNLPVTEVCRWAALGWKVKRRGERRRKWQLHRLRLEGTG